MESHIHEISSFITNSIKEGVKKSESIAKLLVRKPVEVWLKDYTLITGSEAKAYYGFKLHDYTNPLGFRDTDIVLKSVDPSQEFIDLTKFLSEHYEKLEIGATGIISSIPIHFNGEAMYKPALCRFAYGSKFYELFAPIKPEMYNRTGYVSLNTLVECAKEWDRPKDRFFLDQVRALIPVDSGSTGRSYA
jgi:hypothetical protein